MEFWIFLLFTVFLIWVSRKSLLSPRSHGFYRFLAWEMITLLFLLNYRVWFEDPFNWHQILSWVFLFGSIPFGVLGFRQLKQLGDQDANRGDHSLYPFEKTTQLVTNGIYRYIRHPLYASLLLLALGVFFKRINWPSITLVALAVIFLTVTAKIEEKENLAYFGSEYVEYKAKTKMFIPFLY